MKKILSVALVVLFIFSVFPPIQVSANTELAFEVDSRVPAVRSTAETTRTVDVAIRVSNNNPTNAFAGVGFDVGFDPDTLNIVDVSSHVSELPLTLDFQRDIDPGRQRISLMRSGARGLPVDWSGNGLLVTMTFEVLQNAEIGPSTITITFSSDPNGIPSNASGRLITAAQTQYGSVLVSDGYDPGGTRPLNVNLHGGTGGPTFPATIPQTTWTIAPTAPLPTRAGFTFGGWGLAADGTAVTAVPAGTTAVTLHALWIDPAGTRSLSVNLHGGTGGPAFPATIPQTTWIIAPTTPVPTRNGFTFVGWALSADGATITQVGAGAAAVVLHALWTATGTNNDDDDDNGNNGNGNGNGGNGAELSPGTVATPDNHPGLRRPGPGETRPTGPGTLTVLEHFSPPNWTGTGPRTARIDTDHTTFTRLWLGEYIVIDSARTIASGSTTITLPESFISGLADGTHVFLAEFSGGHATPINLVVSRGFGTVPQTGVPTMTGTAMLMWSSIAMTVTLGIALYTHVRKTRRDSIFNVSN